MVKHGLDMFLKDVGDTNPNIPLSVTQGQLKASLVPTVMYFGCYNLQVIRSSRLGSLSQGTQL